MTKVKSFFTNILTRIKTFFVNFNFKIWAREHIETLISLVGLLFCIVFFSIASGGLIWSERVIGNILFDFAPYAILAIGAVFIYSMGFMDVSIGAQLGVFAILTVSIVNKTGSLFLGLIVSAAIALLCGFLNGTVSVFLKLPSIVTSIFLSSIFGGLQLILAQSLTIDEAHPQGQSIIKVSSQYSEMLNVFKEPWLIIIILVVVGIIGIFLFNYTKVGKYTKAIGANELTTAQCGVNTTLYKTIGYSVLAITIAITAVFFTVTKTGDVSKDTGSGLAMEVMLCLILGGMPLSGGMKSKIGCGVIGALIYIILSWGLDLSFADLGNYKYLINSVMFLIVVILTSRRKSELLPR